MCLRGHPSRGGAAGAAGNGGTMESIGATINNPKCFQIFRLVKCNCATSKDIEMNLSGFNGSMKENLVEWLISLNKSPSISHEFHLG